MRVDWVDQVSIELTTQMLAVLFDFPWDDSRKLTRWSDNVRILELLAQNDIMDEQEALAPLRECAEACSPW